MATPMHVLLVEDNTDLLELTREIFETVGCEVTTAVDGAAGLALLTARPPDIAFIDIGLPTLDGYAVATRARERGVRSFLVAMSGYGQPDDKKRALAAGFDRHVTKPVSALILRKTIREAFPGS